MKFMEQVNEIEYRICWAAGPFNRCLKILLRRWLLISSPLVMHNRTRAHRRMRTIASSNSSERSLIWIPACGAHMLGSSASSTPLSFPSPAWLVPGWQPGTPLLAHGATAGWLHGRAGTARGTARARLVWAGAS